jgi:hypothetical protein
MSVGCRALVCPRLTSPLSVHVPYITNTSQLGQRLYFKFCEPIDTAEPHFGGAGVAADALAVGRVRELCKTRLEAGIAALLEQRELDPDRFG